MTKEYLHEFESAAASRRRQWQKFYDGGVPIQVEQPLHPLKYWFNKWAEKTPEKPYLILDDVTLNYQQANMMARALANALLGLGVKKSDRVAVVAPISPQYIIAVQALWKIGAIEVPTNDRYTIPELDYQFRDSSTETVIVSALAAEKMIHLLKTNNLAIKRVIVFGASEKQQLFSQMDGLYDFDDLIENSLKTEPAIEVTVKDTARLQYTGGTTGIPKGCVLSNSAIFIQAMLTAIWYTANFAMVPKDQIRTLCAIPLTHIYGFNANINVCLYTGGTIVLVPEASPENLVKAIIRHQPNIFATVPAMIKKLIDYPHIKDFDLSSIQGIFSGSASLPVELIKKFEEITGGIILEGYGMAEAGCTVTVNPVKTLRKPGSVGIGRPGTDLLVVDLDTGTRVMPDGESGELIVTSPSMMTEYWNHPAETAATIRDGWLYTGDIGKVDEDGFVYIVDRKKDMIICSGFNVYPREVEEVLYSLPQVKDACVIGVPDAKRGETAKAYLSLREGAALTREEVIAHCRLNLAPYKVPKLIEFIKNIPYTSVGKLDRKSLRTKPITELRINT